MKETEKVSFDSMPSPIRGSFLTKEQVEKLKKPFKNLVSIVRCKDCNISKLENVPTSTETVRWCQLINRYVDDDWFCADGERKESR